MKTAANILKSIEDWRNKRRAQQARTKFFSVYLESVGRVYFSDPQNTGELKRNKEIHNTVWNKKVKPKDIRKYF